ncbi:MAG: MBL fold metallo-hydrolase [Candidatus Kaiserbacteria bacterium]|nr:MAG: MBL fold metallo-hydrolase [Candidatus Kaiserbacteria bacterium]
MRRSARLYGIAILVLLVLVFVIGIIVLREDRRGSLTVSFLDVGQGDAIFIDAPSGRQVLIDGGKGSTVLRQLSGVLPFYDRSIDMVAPTHPDADHIGGLLDVLKRYEIGTIIESGVQGDSSIFAAFEKAAQEEGSERLVAKRGDVFDLGGGAQLEILFPDRAVPGVETNTGSLVARLTYGATSFLLPGDAPQNIEEYLARLDGKNLKSNVLKAGHHGSRTSSAALFVGYASPEYAIFSRGCENTYGHPHQEVVDLLARFEIPTLDTCEEGTITFVSDGKTVRRK